MVGRATGADGREWWVGRRWLPWRPRRRGDAVLGDGNLLQMAAGIDEPVGCAVALLLAGVVLALPFIVVLALLVAEWLVVLALLPLWMLARAAFGAPWRVVARGRDADGRRWRYYGRVPGWRASAALIATVQEEIRGYGEPRSLGAKVEEQPDRSGSGHAQSLLARVPGGEALEAPGWVHGTGSPFAQHGWLSGTLRADVASLTVSQGGTLARRAIPVTGGEPMDEARATALPRPGAATAVIGLTGADGREYLIAADAEYLPALRWLQSQWTRSH